MTRGWTNANAALWLTLAVLWSSSYVAIEIGLRALDPILVVFLRMLLASVILLGALKVYGQSISFRLKELENYAVGGLMGTALPFMLITWGEQYLQSSVVAILMSTMPLATLLLAAVLVTDERLTLSEICAVLLGISAIGVLAIPESMAFGDADLLGIIAIIGATICYAISTVYIKLRVSRPAMETATGSMLAGAMMLLVIVVATAQELKGFSVNTASLLAIAYLGVFPTAIASFIYFFLVPRLGAARVAQVNFVIPVSGVFLAFVLLGEPVTTRHIFASALVILSIGLGTYCRADQKSA